MAEAERRARDEGRLPNAPGYVGLCAAVGGLVGLGGGAAFAPWRALAEASWGLQGDPLPLVAEALTVVTLPVLVGALLGLGLGLRSADAWAPALRLGWRGEPPPRQTGLLALVAGGIAASASLALLPSGAGELLIGAPFIGAGLVGAALLAPALLQRHRALEDWRRAREAEAPTHRPDHLRAAMGHRGPVQADLVLTAGVYSVALRLDPPTIVAHGGPELREAARCVEAPELARGLAALPTGSTPPIRLWDALRALND